MEGMRVYLAGPMESVGGNWNIPLFDFVAKGLRDTGCEVFSPADQLREACGSVAAVQKMDPETRKLARQEGLKAEINWIFDFAQVVALLPGWQQSPGATAERAVAIAIGLQVRELDNIIVPPEFETLDQEPK